MSIAGQLHTLLSSMTLLVVGALCNISDTGQCGILFSTTTTIVQKLSVLPILYEGKRVKYSIHGLVLEVTSQMFVTDCVMEGLPVKNEMHLLQIPKVSKRIAELSLSGCEGQIAQEQEARSFLSISFI